MQPLAIHHVSVNVSDVEASLAFYVDCLGGRPRTDRPTLRVNGAWVDLGAAQVHLIEADVPPNLGQHFAILVDDLDAAVEQLRGAGVSVSDPVAVGSGRQSFLSDPDGNLIELHQAAASPA